VKVREQCNVAVVRWRVPVLCCVYMAVCMMICLDVQQHVSKCSHMRRAATLYIYFALNTYFVSCTSFTRLLRHTYQLHHAAKHETRGRGEVTERCSELYMYAHIHICIYRYAQILTHIVAHIQTHTLAHTHRKCAREQNRQIA